MFINMLSIIPKSLNVNILSVKRMVSFLRMITYFIKLLFAELLKEQKLKMLPMMLKFVASMV